MLKIPISQVVEIAGERIVYRDERGDAAYIDLAVCADRYAAAHRDAKPSGANIRCVGERFFGEHAYYAFCAEEPIRLCMELKTGRIKAWISRVTGWNFHAKAFEQFYSVQKRLNAAGWTTLDLT